MREVRAEARTPVLEEGVHVAKLQHRIPDLVAAALPRQTFHVPKRQPRQRNRIGNRRASKDSTRSSGDLGHSVYR